VSELAQRVAPEGDVLVVDRSVDALEGLRETTTASNVFYLVGSMDVLPLTDASVDEILTTSVPSGDAAAEFFRVLRPAGHVAVAAGDQDPTGAALNLDVHEVERLFTEAGFAAVTVTAAQGRLAVAARKP
jgi:ubiquinone/menaquinone biosynthesis C-methylase UbiE